MLPTPATPPFTQPTLELPRSRAPPGQVGPYTCQQACSQVRAGLLAPARTACLRSVGGSPVSPSGGMELSRLPPLPPMPSGQGPPPRACAPAHLCAGLLLASCRHGVRRPRPMLPLPTADRHTGPPCLPSMACGGPKWAHLYSCAVTLAGLASRGPKWAQACCVPALLPSGQVACPSFSLTQDVGRLPTCLHPCGQPVGRLHSVPSPLGLCRHTCGVRALGCAWRAHLGSGLGECSLLGGLFGVWQACCRSFRGSLARPLAGKCPFWAVQACCRPLGAGPLGASALGLDSLGEASPGA